MGESVVNLVRNWLSGRKQRVVAEGEESSWRPVISGVPQGSVLGPILFLIYINDLENEIGSNILKFADDTKMFRRVESQEDRHKLQVDSNKLVKWAEKWQMLFNNDKCKCLHIGQANAKTNYLMNNSVTVNGKGKRCWGHCKFRHEGVGTMWYCSKENKPDIGLDQKEYSIQGYTINNTTVHILSEASS